MRRPIPATTLDKQRRAGDPKTSSWVTANAGSGKTHVLTQRVVRLLLAGTPPAKILCLTFTKAAAANMAQRVYATLAGWTTLDDDALAAELEAIDDHRPTPEQTVHARRLFAHAIETPGGLKIQTIHAFCEALLHRFPFEANAPARFEILDEQSQTDLLASARERSLRDALLHPQSEVGRALTLLSARTSVGSFDKALDEALAARRDLPVFQLARKGGAALLLKELRRLFGLGADEAAEAVERELWQSGLPSGEWLAAAAALKRGSISDGKCGDRLAQAHAATASSDRAKLYASVYLSDKGEPRKRLLTASFRALDPSVAALMDTEQERVVSVSAKWKAAQIVDQTHALLTIIATTLRRYQSLKTHRGMLDFDDLIEKTENLLRRSNASWVLFKLDAGVDHVLVDEAQDTSEPQWEILKKLVEEFTAGSGARTALRTIFAVGDEKQSIYSFQGAAPHLFDAMRRNFADTHRHADKAFDHVLLTMSFRSSQGILDPIDQVFGFGDHARGLSAQNEKPPPHVALKADLPGLVELWDPIPTPKDEVERDWILPVDALAANDPESVLADRITRQIESWLSPLSRDVVHDENGPRRIKKGDVLILARKRGSLFEAMIRSLKDRRIAVAGADRLALTEHIAVMDLAAAGRAALLSQDDLNLACVLKSPLIGLDDDDLLALAPNRTGTLWDALAASSEPRHRAAAERIDAWRQRASLSPFEFYALLLGKDLGRRKLLGRLGPEASDAIDEFIALTLDHSRREAPSLTAFLHELEAAQVSVKRDMDAPGDFVRVMTVHAAKGLEAKIVIMPDTCSTPSAHHDPSLYFLETPAGRVPVYSPRKDGEPEPLARARAASRLAQEDEYRRLLYVAMTRAEERLYVVGVEGRKPRPPGCWHRMIETALADFMTEHPAPWNPDEVVRRLTHIWPEAALEPATVAAPPEAIETPAWLWRKAPAEYAAAPPLRPSSALAAADESQPREATSRDQTRLGRLTHALLQHLPTLPPEAREAAAQRYLAAQGFGLSPEIKRELIDEAIAVIDDPRLSMLFGETARAELSICGQAALPEGASADVIGVVDRLAVAHDCVWIADFKSGAPALDRPPDAYLVQLALYKAVVAQIWPALPIRALLVWTAGPRLVELSDPQYAKALAAAARSRSRWQNPVDQ